MARNLYLADVRTLNRKLQEIRIALALERRFTKDDILEMYLNHIYLGSGAYGVQAAAKPLNIIDDDSIHDKITPYFVEYVCRKLIELYDMDDVYGKRLNVYTTINTKKKS